MKCKDLSLQSDSISESCSESNVLSDDQSSVVSFECIERPNYLKRLFPCMSHNDTFKNDKPSVGYLKCIERPNCFKKLFPCMSRNDTYKNDNAIIYPNVNDEIESNPGKDANFIYKLVDMGRDYISRIFPCMSITSALNNSRNDAPVDPIDQFESNDQDKDFCTQNHSYHFRRLIGDEPIYIYPVFSAVSYKYTAVIEPIFPSNVNKDKKTFCFDKRFIWRGVNPPN